MSPERLPFAVDRVTERLGLGQPSNLHFRALPERCETDFGRMVFFWHFGMRLSEVATTINYLVFLIALLAEANLEPKDTIQLLLSAEISPLESGADGKVPKLFGTEALWHFRHPGRG